jgi:EAL domain-containing protein (putative c-di-GMP-specific phosphodiesterase class I)
MRAFEPIFDLRDKRLVGYEVLYRGVGDREKFFEDCTDSLDILLRVRPPFVKLDIKQVQEIMPWLVKMIKSLQLRPIMEKVETLSEFLQVRKNGVCLIQGRILENGWDRA